MSESENKSSNAAKKKSSEEDPKRDGASPPNPNADPEKKDGEKKSGSDKQPDSDKKGEGGKADEGKGKDGADAKKKPSGPPWYKRPLVAGSVFLGVAVVIIGGTLWWLHSRHYESTDDAAIDVIPQVVSAQLPGRVLRVLVQDNQEVTADTVLIELDPADFKARAEQARASGAQAQAQADQASAQEKIFEAQREQALASSKVAETNADNAAKTAARLSALRSENAGAVSQEQWDQADAGQKSSAAQVEAAHKAVAAAEAQIGYAGSLLKAADAARTSAAAQVEEADLNISYMQIRARVNGRVANLQVAPGNYIQPGAGLMAVVPREVYITAHFKETQLGLMRRGQPVEVKVDAYPDTKLAAHIESFQPGTGQSFSGLPAENATGNWVKVVQRVAVRITLDRIPDDPDRRLGPGMSVEAKVTVR